MVLYVFFLFFSFLNVYSFFILVKIIRKCSSVSILLWVQMWTQSFFLAPMFSCLCGCVHIFWWFPVFYQVVVGSTNSALYCRTKTRCICVVISLNQTGRIKYILCLWSIVIDTEILFACLFHENGRKFTCHTSRERITSLSHGICYFSLRS